ncbi:hypothetical protein J3B02_001005 [Coemansia erecta]|nr:hypothetical protein J3B02_001005 [Coemansia erecta]
MFSGLAPPSPFAAGSNGAQPIPIPMSMPPDGQLADTAGTAFSQLSPYSIYQHPDPRFSSAPHSAAMSFAQNMFGSQSPAGSAGNVSGQSNKQMRPANAIPPHLLETANMNSAMSPINTPQTPFLLTGFPADLTGLSGSFNSAQSDVSEIMSPMGNSSNNATQMMTQKSDETVDMHTLYDIQIPPQQAAGHAAASLGSLSTQSPGISLGECTGSSFLNEDGTLSVFPSTSQPAQSAFIGGDSKKYGHKRTLTQDSSDSLSNMPLLERTSMEVAAAPFEKRYDAGNKMGSSEFDQFLFSLSQHQESIDSFSSALSPEMIE